MYDYLVVGAGIFGATAARELSDAGKQVLVIDKRSTLGGMLHSERVDGVVVHTHGPHVLHCNKPEIWQYIQRFTNIIPYTQRARAIRNGVIYTLPVNLHLLNQVFGVKTPEEAEKLLRKLRIPRPTDAGDLESWVKSQLGEKLYEMFYQHYTKKQWGRNPVDLPEAIAMRLPIRTDTNDRYFEDTYEGMPADGFTPMIQRMFEGIEVRLESDFNKNRAYWRSQARTIIYSGSVDALYDYDLGRLEYRSLRLEIERHKHTFQGCPTMHYPDPTTPWTRITEFNYFPPSKPGNTTVIMKECPEEYDGHNEPYYPINNLKNTTLANAYIERAKKDGFVLGGRLGSYRYYDIHHVIAQAMKIVRDLISQAR